VCLGTSLGFFEKIDPKGFDILVKILKLIPAEEALYLFQA
jgi:hypothetical protein